MHIVDIFFQSMACFSAVFCFTVYFDEQIFY